MVQWRLLVEHGKLYHREKILAGTKNKAETTRLISTPCQARIVGLSVDTLGRFLLLGDCSRNECCVCCYLVVDRTGSNLSAHCHLKTRVRWYDMRMESSQHDLINVG